MRAIVDGREKRNPWLRLLATLSLAVVGAAVVASAMARAPILLGLGVLFAALASAAALLATALAPPRLMIRAGRGRGRAART